MFKTDEIKALVNERLTVAAEEIFSIFEQTIKEYEEMASRSKRELDHQREQWKGKSTEINLASKQRRSRVSTPDLFKITFVKRP